MERRPSAFRSHGDGVNASPGLPPTITTVVPASLATALRFAAGSRTKTNVPAGASISSPLTVNVAWPFRDEVELLVLRRALAELVVLADHFDSRLLGDVRVDAERLDVEVRPHHRPRRSVAELEREVGDVRRAAHAGNSGSSRSQSKSSSFAAYSFACGSSSIARFRCSIAASRFFVSASRQARL